MTTPTVRITSSANMLALIPQLLAFEPQNSFVAVFLAGHRVVVTMRIDLKHLAEADFLDKVQLVVEQTDADSVVLAAYGDERDDLQVLLADVEIDITARMELLGHNLEIVSSIAVTGQRWCSLHTWESGSMEQIRTDPITVRGIVDGVPVARSRQELADLVRPGADPLPAGFGSAFQRTMAEMADLDEGEVAQLTREHLDQWWSTRQIDGPTLGRLVALGTHEGAAAPALARLRSTTAKGWHRLWAAAVRCSQGSAGLLPLVAAAASAWAAGDGATMNAATDHAAALDPEHVMVRLLRTANEQCLSPELWDRFVDKLAVPA